jgi:hypothetical protein
MQVRTIRRLVWLVVPACVAAGLAVHLKAALPAAAAAPPQYVRVSSELGSEPVKSVRVRCPGATVVSGVGGYTNKAGNKVWVEFAIVDPQVVEVTATEDPPGPLGDWYVSGHAVCTNAAGHQVVHATGGSADNIAGANVACPGNKKALGVGGGHIGSNGRAFQMVPSMTGARVQVYDRWSWDGFPVSATVDLVCVDYLPNQWLITKTSAVSSDPERSVKATCFDGTVAYGSGYSTNGAGLTDVFIDAVTVAPTGVTVYAREDPDGTAATWSVTAYAMCGKSG